MCAFTVSRSAAILFALTALLLLTTERTSAAGETAPGFQPPRAIPSSVMRNWPVYTMEARQAHREGVVLLRVKISAEGKPLDIQIARGSTFQDLDVAAVAAVRNWAFTPATQDGVSVETTVTLPINFSLKTAEAPGAAPPVAAAPAASVPKPKPAAKPKKPVAKPKPKAAHPEEAAPAPETPAASPPAEKQ